MAAKDIEKLKEKFEKDPNSKLFLPLAEEYRKEGLLDQAVEVLQQGLEKHPAYTSARVLLGKIYFEKGMAEEARKELESVVASVPDNLFAYKKLSEIYRDTGETALAINACRAILKLNPMDGETLKNLEELESPPAAGHPEEEEAASPEVTAELRMPGEEETPFTAAAESGGETGTEGPDLQTRHAEDELRAFGNTLPGGGDAATGEELLQEAGEGGEAEDEIVLPDEEVYGAGEEITFEDVGEEVQREEDTTGESVPSEEFMAVRPENAGEVPAVAGLSGTPAGEEGLGAADRFIAGGQYAEAMGVYRRLLSANPDSRLVLQRVDELRSLLKLMGKDKEMRIAALDAFLQGIHKGRDEFFGRS